MKAIAMVTPTFETFVGVIAAAQSDVCVFGQTSLRTAVPRVIIDAGFNGERMLLAFIHETLHVFAKLVGASAWHIDPLHHELHQLAVALQSWMPILAPLCVKAPSGLAWSRSPADMLPITRSLMDDQLSWPAMLDTRRWFSGPGSRTGPHDTRYTIGASSCTVHNRPGDAPYEHAVRSVLIGAINVMHTRKLGIFGGQLGTRYPAYLLSAFADFVVRETYPNALSFSAQQKEG